MCDTSRRGWVGLETRLFYFFAADLADAVGLCLDTRERGDNRVVARLEVGENRRVILATHRHVRLVGEVCLHPRLRWHRLPIVWYCRIRAANVTHSRLELCLLLFKLFPEVFGLHSAQY